MSNQITGRIQLDRYEITPNDACYIDGELKRFPIKVVSAEDIRIEKTEPNFVLHPDFEVNFEKMLKGDNSIYEIREVVVESKSIELNIVVHNPNLPPPRSLYDAMEIIKGERHITVRIAVNGSRHWYLTLQVGRAFGRPEVYTISSSDGIHPEVRYRINGNNYIALNYVRRNKYDFSIGMLSP